MARLYKPHRLAYLPLYLNTARNFPSPGIMITQVHKLSAFQVIGLFLILTGLIVGKDLLHASIHNYSFYLSESLLFSAFWLLFIPILFWGKYLRMPPLIRLCIWSLIHISLFSLYIWTVSSIFFTHSFEFHKTFLYTVSDQSIVCLLVYGVFTRYSISTPIAASEEFSAQVYEEKIAVTYQHKTLVLDCKDILYVKAEKPYIALITRERKYLLTSSLKKFMTEKSPSNFIQIHRSTLVNTSYITSYVSRKNGDYDVQLDHQHWVRASRSYNQNFKPFFKNIGLA